MLQANYTVKLLIQEIAQIRIEAARLSKRESELKAELRSYMGSEKLLVSEDHCVVIETRNRTDLNKEALAHDMGMEFMHKYQTRTEYEIMSIKPISKAG
jgi:hypothetical protein